MYKIYLFRQMDLLSEEWVETAMALLPEERRKRAMRYRQKVDRQNCVVAYVLLKLVLWECFGIRKFELEYGVWGKPYLKDWPGVFVNICHCKMGCAVVASDCPVGMDMEVVRPFSWEVAKRVCNEKEIQALREGGKAERDRAFIHMWVGKESYVKWLGMGLLQEYYLIVLDVFQKFPYSKDRNELTAWLSLLTIEEVLGMFSKALRRQLRNQANT